MEDGTGWTGIVVNKNGDNGGVDRTGYVSEGLTEVEDSKRRGDEWDLSWCLGTLTEIGTLRLNQRT